METLERVAATFRGYGISGWGIGALHGHTPAGYDPEIAGRTFVHAMRPKKTDPDHDNIIVANFRRNVDEALAWGERFPATVARVVAQIRQERQDQTASPHPPQLKIILGQPKQGSFPAARA